MNNSDASGIFGLGLLFASQQAAADLIERLAEDDVCWVLECEAKDNRSELEEGEVKFEN